MKPNRNVTQTIGNFLVSISIKSNRKLFSPSWTFRIFRFKVSLPIPSSLRAREERAKTPRQQMSKAIYHIFWGAAEGVLYCAPPTRFPFLRVFQFSHFRFHAPKTFAQHPTESLKEQHLNLNHSILGLAPSSLLPFDVIYCCQNVTKYLLPSSSFISDYCRDIDFALGWVSLWCRSKTSTKKIELNSNVKQILPLCVTRICSMRVADEHLTILNFE